MFRLWVLTSAAWIMGWLIFFAIEFISGQPTTHDFLVVPVVLLGPPVALLLMGVATRWAFQGFNVDDRFPKA
jgi:predicted membrane-bound dolichyl-phosphate-mannose-protein mannosyltransferase